MYIKQCSNMLGVRMSAGQKQNMRKQFIVGTRRLPPLPISITFVPSLVAKQSRLQIGMLWRPTTLHWFPGTRAAFRPSRASLQGASVTGSRSFRFCERIHSARPLATLDPVDETFVNVLLRASRSYRPFIVCIIVYVVSGATDV